LRGGPSPNYGAVRSTMDPESSRVPLMEGSLGVSSAGALGVGVRLDQRR